jgi:antitoxin CptB
MNISTEDRLKRIRMRSWRRGMREMDLILGGFADTRLNTLSPGELDLFEDLLSEMDQDLYDWASQRSDTPQRYQSLMQKIAKSGS